MLDQLTESLQGYRNKWEALAAENPNLMLLELKPDAMGWKVANETEYLGWCNELRGSCDKVIETWMNDRWIAKMILRKPLELSGIRIIKIMQRRPGSDDALGMDHMDFYVPDMQKFETLLKAQEHVKWSWETNNAVDNYKWLSIWFDGTEAKLKSYTVLDLVQQELATINAEILGKKA